MKFKGYSGNRVGREFYVYRYIEKKTGAVVYVGKTNCSLKARINAHKRESWFAPYDCYVEFVKLSNEVETDSVEKFLINYYKPAINLKDKVPFSTVEISLSGLDWHPYEEYLEGLKMNRVRLEVLKKEALKQVFTLEKLEEAVLGKETTVVLPFVSTTLPFLDGLFLATEKEVSQIKGGYLHHIKDDAVDVLKNRYNEILAAIWLPVAISSETGLDGIVLFEKAMELFQNMEEFARDGYLYEEDFYEAYVNIVPLEYEPVVCYFEKYTEPVQKYSDKIFIEWTMSQNDEMPKIKEEICKDFVAFLRRSGIWSYKDEAGY